VVTRSRAILEDRLGDTPLDLRGFDRPRALIDAIEEDLTPLLDLVKRPVISARQFTREQLLQLARLSARFETQPQLTTRPLTGKILISAFYEPSTRTRLSFESAWHRLGGDIMSITDTASTGIAKGESLGDIGEMLNNYGDLVVLRDSNVRSVYDMAESLRIPIISGGNGYDEHPTQALADVYALLKWRPRIESRDTDPLRRDRRARQDAHRPQSPPALAQFCRRSRRDRRDLRSGRAVLRRSAR
jgi:aspartate carbamoyltransferase catalytic subunit